MIDTLGNVTDIVSWFRVINASHMKLNHNVKSITQMKIMKLLYYVQGVSLALYNTPAFSDPIKAWEYGPVVEKVHKDFYGDKALPSIDKNSIKGFINVQKNPKLLKVVNSVEHSYGNMTAIELMYKTHQEAPWKRTYKAPHTNYSINLSLMRKYFVEHIIL